MLSRFFPEKCRSECHGTLCDSHFRQYRRIQQEPGTGAWKLPESLERKGVEDVIHTKLTNFPKKRLKWVFPVSLTSQSLYSEYIWHVCQSEQPSFKNFAKLHPLNLSSHFDNFLSYGDLKRMRYIEMVHAFFIQKGWCDQQLYLALLV